MSKPCWVIYWLGIRIIQNAKRISAETILELYKNQTEKLSSHLFILQIRSNMSVLSSVKIISKMTLEKTLIKLICMIDADKFQECLLTQKINFRLLAQYCAKDESYM